MWTTDDSSYYFLPHFQGWPPLRAWYLAPLCGRLDRSENHCAFLQARRLQGWPQEMAGSDRC
ncbi:hypothetical protein D6D22_02233 [Aureobasidium pullulans]|uniref:Uncharacterized protein n=1 Tax=Aureobasidium pullulans TaxID=5580 RepID=A0A4S8YD35_AURPU|nr:hypothetical protein D6D22_02233 [Aureobasidium pullulans]